jgi:mRNA-degrading endonuclease toxin of MazEF toxin-antitoxin module
MLSKETRNSAFITADNTKFVGAAKEYRHYVVILKATIKETVTKVLCCPITTIVMLPPA